MLFICAVIQYTANLYYQQCVSVFWSHSITVIRKTSPRHLDKYKLTVKSDLQYCWVELWLQCRVSPINMKRATSESSPFLQEQELFHKEGVQGSVAGSISPNRWGTSLQARTAAEPRAWQQWIKWDKNTHVISEPMTGGHADWWILLSVLPYWQWAEKLA